MADIIVSTSGTSGGMGKQLALSPEIMKLRVDMTDVGKGKNITECKVVYVAKAIGSSSFQRWKAWAEARNKKIVSAIKPDKIIETFANEKVDAIDAAPGYLVMVARIFEATGKSADLKQVISGHSTMSRADALYVQKWLGKDLQIGYGCTEIGTIASGTAEEVADIDGCVGKPLEGITVEIDAGYIRIKSPTMAENYLDFAEMDAVHFRNGWFYPGDTGYLTADGRLVITKNR
jgi:long-subunit acyl-CoA synthetase (AMP-forming)